jgi:hypothetical protein
MNCVDTNVTTNSPRIRRIISKNQSRAAASTLTRRGRDRIATSHLHDAICNVAIVVLAGRWAARMQLIPNGG